MAVVRLVCPLVHTMMLLAIRLLRQPLELPSANWCEPRSNVAIVVYDRSYLYTAS